MLFASDNTKGKDSMKIKKILVKINGASFDAEPQPPFTVPNTVDTMEIIHRHAREIIEELRKVEIEEPPPRPKIKWPTIPWPTNSSTSQTPSATTPVRKPRRKKP